MTTRKVIGWSLLGLLALGIGNFAVSAIQTRGSLGLIAHGGADAKEGVSQLMSRHVLFDALQGGAPPQTRLNAIAALADVAKDGKDPASFSQLLQMLKDPDTETIQEKTHPVRDAAKDAVAADGQQYPDLLLDAAKDPDGNLHDQARAALKQIGAPLETQMASRLGDPDLRAPLGDILSGIGPDTVQLVIPYLQPDKLAKFTAPDDLEKAKLELLVILGKYKVTPAAQAVLPFDKDPDPNVRRAVLAALANIADPVGEPTLIAALTDATTDSSARAAAAATLGAFGTKESNDAMVTALSDFDLAVADAAASGLARAATTNEATASPAIARALASSDPAVRVRAASATGGMTSATLAQAAFRDPNEEVRAAAATSLGEILSKRSAAAQSDADIAPLVAGLKDTSGAVADASMAALVRIGAAAVPDTARLLSDPNDATAYYAARTLAAIGEAAYDTVVADAAIGKPEARWAAVTLGEIGDARAEQTLQALEASPDPDTANAAETALVKVKG